MELLLSGLHWTIIVAISSWIIALALGTVVGVARTLDNRAISLAASAYIEIFRNIPLIVQMFLWYFVVPELLPSGLSSAIKRSPDASLYVAIVSLGFYAASRVGEQVRAGIQASSKGQRDAAVALGMTTFQVYRYAVLPVVFRRLVPSLTSDFLDNIKNTSVALTIGLAELTARAREMAEFTFQIFEAFTVATLLYILINSIVAVLSRRIEIKYALPGAIGAK